jgi:hypothetical protein
MIILDIVLMTLVSVAIVSFLTWSVWMQHRDPGCETLRIRRRLHVKVRLLTLGQPRTGSIAAR